MAAFELRGIARLRSSVQPRTIVYSIVRSHVDVPVKKPVNLEMRHLEFYTVPLALAIVADATARVNTDDTAIFAHVCPDHAKYVAARLPRECQVAGMHVEELRNVARWLRRPMAILFNSYVDMVDSGSVVHDMFLEEHVVLD